MKITLILYEKLHSRRQSTIFVSTWSTPFPKWSSVKQRNTFWAVSGPSAKHFIFCWCGLFFTCEMWSFRFLFYNNTQKQVYVSASVLHSLCCASGVETYSDTYQTAKVLGSVLAKEISILLCSVLACIPKIINKIHKNVIKLVSILWCVIDSQLKCWPC